MFGDLTEKKYYSISEVATHFKVNTSLLRYWEKEFDQINPSIKSSGIRKYTKENIENISNAKKFEINKKYQFLDDIFLRVLDENPEMMPDIFFKMFETSPKTVIKFLSNKSNFLEDLSIILKMPKWTFIKALFN